MHEKSPVGPHFRFEQVYQKSFSKNNIANIFVIDSNIFILRRWIQRAGYDVCKFLRHEIAVRPADFKLTFDVSVSAMRVWSRDTWCCLISFLPYERLIICSSHMHFQTFSTRWKKAHVNTIVACQYLSWLCTECLNKFFVSERVDVTQLASVHQT